MGFYSGDGKLALSTSGGNGKIDPEDSTIMVRDAESSKLLRQIHIKKACFFGLVITPDGNRAFGAMWLGGQAEDAVFALIVWDLKTGKELKCWADPGHAITMAIAPNGKRGLTYSKEGLVLLWHLETGKNLQSFSADPSSKSRLAITNCNQKTYLYSISQRLSNHPFWGETPSLRFTVH